MTPARNEQPPEKREANYIKRVWEIVRRIPGGRVATYGQVARLAGRCTPRMAGYALAALPEGSDVPWHRVINHQGRISVRADGRESPRQRLLLETEGVRFEASGAVCLSDYQWDGETRPKRPKKSKTIT